MKEAWKIKRLMYGVMNKELIDIENKILKADFITQNNDFDFQLLIDNGFFKLQSSLGENLKINGYYRNNDDLNFDIKILDLIVNDLYQINV